MYVITAATGNVGGALVGELLQAGVPVRALTRDPATARMPAGVEPACTADLPLAGATGLFVNPAAFPGGVEELLRTAVAEGVQRVVTLSSNSVLADLSDNAIAQLHQELEAQVEATGLEWTHLRPGAFATNAHQWQRQLHGGDTVYGPYADAHTAPVHEADIAAVAAHALLTDELVGQAPDLSGPELLTFPDQVRLLGEALGRELEYVEIPPDAAREAMVREGVPAAIADALLQYYVAGGSSTVSHTVPRVTGRPARTFASWAAEHAEDFR